MQGEPVCHYLALRASYGERLWRLSLRRVHGPTYRVFLQNMSLPKIAIKIEDNLVICFMIRFTSSPRSSS